MVRRCWPRLVPAAALSLAGLATAGGAQAGAGAGELGVAPVRGVAPEELWRYAPSSAPGDERKLFRCLNGGESARLLPYSAVNDDFCDCADGSDEPGTNACAGQSTTLFYCPNARSRASYIYTSQVNDGVCDCCDGSDEYRPLAGWPAGSCPDGCAAEGHALEREVARREAELRAGRKQRQVLVERAKADRASKREELSSLNASLPQLRSAEERRRAAANASIASDQGVASVDEAGAGTGAPSLAAAGSSGSAAASEPAPADEPAASRRASAESSSAAATGAIAAPEAAVVSEYAKWMEGAGEAAPASPDGEAAGAAAEGEEEEEDEEGKAGAEDARRGRGAEDGGVFATVRRWLSSAWASVFGPARTPLERALDEAEAGLSGARKAAVEASERVKKLQEDLEAIPEAAGDADNETASLAFSGLSGRCLSKKIGEYKYEVCFFDKASQDSISIGRWRGWEPAHTALFDDGQWCPGGPARSLRVRFRCGATETLEEVTEPSRCAYEATATHPAACSEDPSAAVQRWRAPRRPTTAHEEL